MIHIINKDVLSGLAELQDKSVSMVCTSPPYWGLRDYGCDGQIGLEKTPEEYIAKMVAVFQAVKRVLRDDGTLWLNLGSSYAGSWGDSGHRPERDGVAGTQREKNSTFFRRDGHPTMAKPPTAAVCGKRSNPSPLPLSVLACGNDGTARIDSQGAGRACPDSDDGCQDGKQTHRDHNFHNVRSDQQDEQPNGTTSHDTGRLDCDQATVAAGHLVSPASTKNESFLQQPDASSLSTRASVDQKGTAIVSSDALMFGDNSACTPGKAGPLQTSASGTEDKESFYSACHSPNCSGVGDCVLCWIIITMKSLKVKQKDLISIPHLLALALQADGWYLRSDIIWYKRNPMPESVTDRPTKAHEYIFLLTKSQRYFYDAEAVKEQSVTEPHEIGTTQRELSNRTPNGNIYNRTGRNARSVWDITTKGYPGAHFATFPPELPERCIKAGTSERGVCSAMIKKLKIKKNPPPEKMAELMKFLELNGRV